MRFSLRTAILGLGLSGLVFGLVGCGSANNDQGMSFTLLGFFASTDGEEGDAGQILQLSSDSEAGSASGGATTFVGLQNNLVGQGVRTQRAFLSFYVEGSQIQPPDTTQALATVLGPVAASDDTDSNTSSVASTLPDGWSSIANQKYVETYIVPPDIMAWLNLNRNDLPELPFTMTVHMYVTGLTTSGDRLDTNPVDYFVQFVADNVITPTDGGSTSSEAATETEGVEILE